jgi:serine/threonine-protein kinase
MRAPPFPQHAVTSSAQTLGRYSLIDKLGEGGMGTVYKAYDPKLDRLVAVKVPRFELGKWEVSMLVQRFLREARAAAQIRHPNVCPIYDADEQDGVPFVVMAFVEGRSLAERLRQVSRFSAIADAVRLVRQVALGLKAVHAHGIVHRDLKPANILLDSDGQPLLTDFGLARPEHDAQRMTLHGAVLGTPGYMSPEQAAGESERVGPSTDIYSLSVVLYNVLTGSLPFRGSAITVLTKVLNETPPAPSSLRPDIDRALEAIILKGMARRTHDRYQSAQELIDAIDGWLAGQTNLPQTTERPATGDFLGDL